MDEKDIKLVADLHCHTISSGHGFSTVYELAQAAKEKGLLMIGITDHGPCLPGGPHPYYFGGMKYIPDEIVGVRILKGIEANIIDEDGSIDLHKKFLKDLDLVIAGFHGGCGYMNLGTEGNTRTLINVIKNGEVKIISHPGNPQYPINFEDVVKAAYDYNVALEINNASFSITRLGSKEHCQRIAELIHKYGGWTIIASDAHHAQWVGCFDEAIRVVINAGISPDKVLNTSIEKIEKFLGLNEKKAAKVKQDF